jgi:hypothetical protein
MKQNTCRAARAIDFRNEYNAHLRGERLKHRTARVCVGLAASLLTVSFGWWTVHLHSLPLGVLASGVVLAGIRAGHFILTRHYDP